MPKLKSRHDAQESDHADDGYRVVEAEDEGGRDDLPRRREAQGQPEHRVGRDRDEENGEEERGSINAAARGARKPTGGRDGSHELGP